MRILIVLSILLFLFTQCNNNPVTDRTGDKEIRGYVTDEFSGLGIDSAEITIQATDFTTFSDTAGVFSFKDIDYGTYRVFVNKDEYKTEDFLIEYYGNGVKNIDLIIGKNILIGTTDSTTYQQEEINYTILNNTVFSAFFDHCCTKVIYALVENKGGEWVFSDWHNINCDAYCDKTPIEILPDSLLTGTVSINESGIYKIAFLHGYNPEYTKTDTVFTNTFTLMKK